METRSAERGEQDTVLELKDVTVSFEMSRGRTRVLDDIDLDIHRNEVLGIVGESGSGKTMFASAIMDAVRDPGVLSGSITYHPEEGESVDVLDLNRPELNQLRWEEIAMVTQGSKSAFNPTLDIRTHFVETFDAHDVDRESGLEQARDLLRELNLEPDEVMDRYQHELSGGQKQRVLLGLSLVFEPEVLILDEPVTALDLIMQRSLLNLLADIREEYDFTLVIISHNIPIIAGLVDRIGVMYAFELVELGDVMEVLQRPEHPYTRLLFRSTLDVETPLDAVETIDGSPPDPVNVPTGCTFHPRCPIADDRCEVEEPELRSEDENDHEVACFYPNEAVDGIPMEDVQGDDQR